MPSQCFLSYAHHDHAGFDRLRIHLTPYAHLYGLKIWHDQRLIAGSYWNIRIQDEITRSQIFVLLTTISYPQTTFYGMNFPRFYNAIGMLARSCYRLSTGSADGADSSATTFRSFRSMIRGKCYLCENGGTLRRRWLLQRNQSPWQSATGSVSCRVHHSPC
jgi:hypothetical protein